MVAVNRLSYLRDVAVKSFGCLHEENGIKPHHSCYAFQWLRRLLDRCYNTSISPPTASSEETHRLGLGAQELESTEMNMRHNFSQEGRTMLVLDHAAWRAV